MAVGLAVSVEECSAMVSALVQFACSFACLAFISFSMSIVKLPIDCPAATALTMLAIGS